MLDKDDFVSRKVRAYLKQSQEYEEEWYLYTVIKDTLFRDDWPINNPSLKEAKALQEALDDWKIYVDTK